MRIIGPKLSHLAHRMTVESLPSELWLIILGLAKEMIIRQYEDCDFKNIPMLYHQIRDPGNRSAINGSCRQLRLVCRMFKALLKSSPQHFLTCENTSVPVGTRVVTIVPYSASSLCLQRAIRRQAIANHILYLQFPCSVSQLSEGSEDFSLLCSNSNLLPSIRSLALNFYDLTAQSHIMSFWIRLNTAFPLLVSLALLSSHRHGRRLANFTSSQDPLAIFEHLQVIVVDNIGLNFRIKLPVIRHITLAFPGELSKLYIGSHLESLIFLGHEDLMPMIIRAKKLPPLRLLGIPFSGILATIPLPKNYPLEHLCVFFLSPSSTRTRPAIYYLLPKLILWIEFQLKHFPLLSQITLDTTMTSAHDQAGIECVISSANLPSIGLLVPSFARGQRSIVLERDPLFCPLPALKKITKRRLRFSLF